MSCTSRGKTQKNGDLKLCPEVGFFAIFLGLYQYWIMFGLYFVWIMDYV